MILIFIGEHNSGKTHLLKALGNVLFEFRGHDDLGLDDLRTLEHVFFRDAAAHEIVVIAIRVEDFNRDKDEMAKIFRQWGKRFTLQVLQTIPFIPSEGDVT